MRCCAYCAEMSVPVHTLLLLLLLMLQAVAGMLTCSAEVAPSTAASTRKRRAIVRSARRVAHAGRSVDRSGESGSSVIFSALTLRGRPRSGAPRPKRRLRSAGHVNIRQAKPQASSCHQSAHTDRQIGRRRVGHSRTREFPLDLGIFAS